MDLQLQGKRALITGASRGIGRAIAERLAAEECDLAICARDAAAVDEAAAALRSKGVKVVAGAVDVGDAAAYRAWLGDAVEELGGLDVLVPNTSAGNPRGEEGFRLGFEVDLLGFARAAEVAMPALRASGCGSIVGIGSTAAIETTLSGMQPYSSMKAAIVAYAGGLAQENGDANVRVNVVSPGPIAYPGNPWDRRGQEDHPRYRQILEATPLGRLGTPDEVARLVVFLASPAAAWITGAHVVVDGGMTKRIAF